MKLGLKSAALAGLLLSSSALAYADDYEVWNFKHEDEKTYAIANTDTGKTALIEVKNGKETFFKGSAAKAKIKKIKGKMPAVPHAPHVGVLDSDSKVVVVEKIGDGEDVVVKLDGDNKWVGKDGAKNVFVMKQHKGGDGEDIIIELDGENEWIEKGSDKHVVVGDTKDISVFVSDNGSEHVIIDLQGDDVTTGDIKIDVEAILEKHGINTTSGDKKSSVVVKRLGEGDAPRVIIKKKEIVKSKNLGGDAATPPTPPTPPSIGKGDGHTVSKHTYKFSVTDDEANSKSVFVHMKGIEDEEAEEFVDDLEVSKKLKSKLKKTVGL